jgi:hypothetical protein
LVLQKPAEIFLAKPPTFFSKFFGENIFKIIKSVPDFYWKLWFRPSVGCWLPGPAQGRAVHQRLDWRQRSRENDGLCRPKLARFAQDVKIFPITERSSLGRAALGLRATTQLHILRTGLWSRVARFFLVNITQAGKMYQKNTKITKWS